MSHRNSTRALVATALCLTALASASLAVEIEFQVPVQPGPAQYFLVPVNQAGEVEIEVELKSGQAAHYVVSVVAKTKAGPEVVLAQRQDWGDEGEAEFELHFGWAQLQSYHWVAVTISTTAPALAEFEMEVP